MRKIGFGLLIFLFSATLYAQENIDKLDELDKQSKEFFNAITGLEKEYIQEQIQQIKSKVQSTNPNALATQNQETGQMQSIEPELSMEELSKNKFTYQNEITKITTDFTRTKKLKDLKIKSMYSFNGKNYVVLKLQEEGANNTLNQVLGGSELTSTIEGRYTVGDYILGHRVESVNVRTKSLELYKKLDDEYGYSIYLSNYGISVSDLKKIEKPAEKVAEVKKEEPKKEEKTQAKVEKAVEVKKEEIKKEEPKAVEKVEVKAVEKLDQIKEEPKIEAVKETAIKTTDCLYTVNKANLNVRENISTTPETRVLRILRQNDKFTISERNGNWLLIDKIYRVSGSVMDVNNQNNWVLIAEDSVSGNENCK